MVWISVFGAPGTGKTKFIERKAEKVVKEEGNKDVIFLSFSNPAVENLRQRLKPYGVPQDSISTLHSFCYKLSKNANLIGRKRIKPNLFMEFCRERKIPYSYDEGVLTDGNLLEMKYSYIVNTNYHKYLDREKIYDILVKENEKLYEYVKWKENTPFLDFTDLIMYGLDAVYDFTLEELLGREIKYAFYDEVQDHSPLEWEVLKMMSVEIDNVYFAGDDCQAIYSFKPSNPDDFIDLSVDERIILNKTYRLPENILNFSYHVMSTIPKYVFKNVEPVKEGGEIYITNLSIRDLYNLVMKEVYSGKSVYVLARTNMLAKVITSYFEKFNPQLLCKGLKISDETVYRNRTIDSLVKLYYERDINFFDTYRIASWVISGKKSNKLREEMRKKKITNKQTLIHFLEGKKKIEKRYLMFLDFLFRKKKPYVIYVDTIHASKGLEADVIFYIDNVSEFLLDIPEESRVKYVGVTRPKEKLYICYLNDIWDTHLVYENTKVAMQTEYKCSSVIEPFFGNVRNFFNLLVDFQISINKKIYNQKI